ncbi:BRASSINOSTEROID INSENSITIVE 1 protein [Nymphaea thermarum]|nr:BRASSINOSTEROID INSENSITIVE 1 protein [Nymphaea thermarum]
MKGEAASCHPNQSLALLQFQQSISQGSQPLLSTWKNESDCCEWEGISCSHTTGFVIGLDIWELRVQVSDPNSSLFQLSHLQGLHLSGNLVTGVNLSRLSELTDLTKIRLSDCNLSRPIPESFKQLSSLTYLDLSRNGLSGEIPLGIVKHPNLQTLLLGNNKLNGSFPDFGNEFSPLVYVDLSNNMLDGEIPPSIIRKLPHLELLFIGGNRFSGTIDFSIFQSMRNLSVLNLSWNNLTVEFPKTVYVNNQTTILPNLGALKLASCNIKGEFPWFLQNAKAVWAFDLSQNNISGKVPTWVWRIPTLDTLDLSHNKLDGFEETVNSNGSRNLVFPLSLYVSNNNIKGAIPSTLLCNVFIFDILDLSENHLAGTIPDCLANFSFLELNLNKNQLRGRIPRRLICGPQKSLPSSVDLSDNQFTGEMRRLLYNCSDNYMSTLDLSNNRLTGSLPDNWPTAFVELVVLDLSNNQLQGPIPEEFSNSSTPALQVLNLNDNKFVGRIPRNLSTCSKLMVINLSNNELSDVFPFWLGHLDQLRVLALRSNKLQGSLSSPFSMHMFSSLLILDISENQLKGHLPSVLFQNFGSMMKKQVSDSSKDPSALSFIGGGRTLSLTIKGQHQTWRLITILICIDLSNNLFTGRIPDDIGALDMLYSLNLSRNNLDGSIPMSFGQLQNMESLDLSHNHLSGNIPEELAHDTFLSTLDLSYNNLQGRIPQGNQFETFDAISFDGNPGLCGPPMAISCPSTNRGPQGSINHVKEMTRDLHWEYLAVGIGFAVGFLTTILPILFIQKVGTWFCVHVDSGNLVTGEILSRLSELTDLTEIRLQDCNLSGPIPESFKQLSSLTYLDLSLNGLSGEIPPGIVKHPNLQTLRLGNNKLNGSFPDFGNEFSPLVDVDLSDNMLDGEIPPSIIRKLPHLGALDIGGNKFSGAIDFSLFQNMKNLSYLDLSWNYLTVEFSKTVYVNHQATIFLHLETLYLMSCNIKGEFPWLLQNTKALGVLDLSQNNIIGKVPTWVWKLPELAFLDVSHNKLDGFEEPVNINGSRNLAFSLLYVSNNNINGKIPSALFCDMFALVHLDLSKNNLTGTIPDCLANLTLVELNLSKNQLRGRIQRRLICDSKSPSAVDLSDNQFTSEMTRLLYNCSNNHIWLSNNRLTGSLPDNWPTDFHQLAVLDLSNNQLQGPIPNEFSNSSTPALQVLNLKDNKLVGWIPMNLSMCSELTVINLGNNELSDVFPFWLGHLDNLRVLVLRSNKLHGSISPLFSMHLFSSLLILDIAGNQLMGHIPSTLFQNFSFMMRKQTNVSSKGLSIGGQTTVLTIKGQSKKWRLISILASIDLSNNLFTGGIPEDIGAVKELYSLNLSWNNLDGPIPRTFGQLQNGNCKTWRNIPEELANVTFLSTLDLSYNNLQGIIPQGNQFDTFSATSFDGNPRLCGPPLAISCPSNGPPPVISESRASNGSQDSINSTKEKALNSCSDYAAGLYLLNLSSNSLDGPIPRSLGNLENTEALNLSHNHLSGSIPEELTNDTFLSVTQQSSRENPTRQTI